MRMWSNLQTGDGAPESGADAGRGGCLILQAIRPGAPLRCQQLLMGACHAFAGHQAQFLQRRA